MTAATGRGHPHRRRRMQLLRRLTPMRVARKIWRTVYRRDYLAYRGMRLPLKDARGVLSGEAFCSDEFFHQSGIVEARRLVARMGYKKSDAIVDIGSGLGRLATGMLWEFGEDVNYLGIEVRPEFVQWCQRNIEQLHPAYRFVHLDVLNDRYNPGAAKAGDVSVRLPIKDAEIDIAYLWGVFTNIGPEDVLFYAGELARILKPDGKAFLTAFIEHDVPDVSFNPPGYGPYIHDGSPLLVVRYSYGFLLGALQGQGLKVDEVRHHGGGFPYQSELYFSK